LLKVLWGVFSAITATQTSMKHSSTERHYYELLPIPQAGSSSSLSLEQSRERPVSAGCHAREHDVRGKYFQSRPSFRGADQEIKIRSRQAPNSYFSFLSLGNKCFLEATGFGGLQ